MDHLLKLCTGDASFAFRLFIDEMQLLGDIARTEKKHAFAWQPVASRPSSLLIIAFNVFRQIVMHDEAHIRLIDAHSERDSGSDDAYVLAQKCILMLCSLRIREPPVVRLCGNAVIAQVSRERFGALAAGTINYPAVVRPAPNELEQLVVGRSLRNYAICEIRPIEAGHVGARIAQF